MAGRTHTRAFENCFENLDGDEVVVALMRRAEKNSRLRREIETRMSMEVWQPIYDRLKHLTYAELRARSLAKHEAYARQYPHHRARMAAAGGEH